MPPRDDPEKSEAAAAATGTELAERPSTDLAPTAVVVDADEDEDEDKLWLSFHGRVIDHLGIQMYQSPVAAFAELVANAWDSDAEVVKLTLPATLSGGGEKMIIEDDGHGMTFIECQKRYLNVGYNRRQEPEADKSREKRRIVLGRKGIGKFAGFGIAQVIVVETVAKATGEKTVFKLDLRKIRGEEYVLGPIEVDVIERLGPDEDRKSEHGTKIKLEELTIGRAPDARFPRSMSRRFLLHQRVEDFCIKVNGNMIPEGEDIENIEFSFPKDYVDAEKPAGLVITDDGWGEEILPNDGNKIRWQIVFYKDPVDDQELSGVAVFAGGKVAELPFFFGITGGSGAQWAQSYMSGRVEADHLDTLNRDLIATERQRVDWEAPEVGPLRDWGRDRIDKLSRIWQKRRAQAKQDAIDVRLSPLAHRLGKLPASEEAIVRRALKALVDASELPQEKFLEIGDALLTAWEGGRLKDLITAVAGAEDLPEGELLRLLMEANVLTALQTAEAVKVKLRVLEGLHQRIEERELENAVRNYIAENPWLISPEWETYRVEKNVNHIIEAAADEAGVNKDEAWTARVDLVLSSGTSLVVVEFMRPGLKADWDHLGRYERYVRVLRQKIEANTALGFTRVTGYLVADKLDKDGAVVEKLKSLRIDHMEAMEWETLLRNAASRWREFFAVLVGRDPEDERLRALAENLGVEVKGGADKGAPDDAAEETPTSESEGAEPEAPQSPDGGDEDASDSPDPPVPPTSVT